MPQKSNFERFIHIHLHTSRHTEEQIIYERIGQEANMKKQLGRDSHGGEKTRLKK